MSKFHEEGVVCAKVTHIVSMMGGGSSVGGVKSSTELVCSQVGGGGSN